MRNLAALAIFARQIQRAITHFQMWHMVSLAPQHKLAWPFKITTYMLMEEEALPIAAKMDLFWPSVVEILQ
jgi:hypothetical protein